MSGRRASNADRIAKAAAEAEAGVKEKAEKKPAEKKPATPRPSRARAPKPPQRWKIVWGVGKPGTEPATTYPYAQRAAADAHAAKSGGGNVVMPVRVPMEPGE